LSEAQSRLGETLSPEREPAGTLQWPLLRSRLGEKGSPERKKPFRLGEDLQLGRESVTEVVVLADVTLCLY